MNELDSFAAAALTGILSDPRAEATPNPTRAAIEAYVYAQAMLKERQQNTIKPLYCRVKVRTLGSPESPKAFSCADDLAW
jgi:hypothetical protein